MINKVKTLYNDITQIIHGLSILKYTFQNSKQLRTFEEKRFVNMDEHPSMDFRTQQPVETLRSNR